MNETPLNKAKELCELGICCSMAHARRVIATLDPKRVDVIIKRNKKIHPILPTITK